MTEIRIHNTQETDLDEILRMEAHPENAPYILPNSKAEHLALIADPNIAHLFLKSSNHKVLGFVILAGLKDKNQNIELRRIVIKTKGKGFGRLAIKKIKEYCFEELNGQRLWLDVLENNERARYLYHSEGFREKGKLKEGVFINNKFQNLILMDFFKQRP